MISLILVVVSVLFLIGLFGNVASYLILIGLGFMGLAYLVVYLGAISILFLFILMLINIRISELQSNTRNTIVRRCVCDYDGYLNISGLCTKRSPARELGHGESPGLNLASLFKGKISPNVDGRVACRAEFSMVKTLLFEVYAQGASLSGLQLATYRLYSLISGMVWLPLIRTKLIQGRRSTHKVQSGQPKENINIITRTTGLPKARKGYGNRGFVVPVNLERNPGYNLRTFASGAGTSGTVLTDGASKIRKILDSSRANPNCQLNKLYKILYDPSLFEAAYQRLKSKPGNMSPGITPTTLDGMSMDVINGLISKLKDGTFKFSPGRRVNIPKSNGGTRPLTIAPPRDKLVQEVLRNILEAAYEPGFSEKSHGFRSGKSCHSALREIKSKFQSAT